MEDLVNVVWRELNATSIHGPMKPITFRAQEWPSSVHQLKCLLAAKAKQQIHGVRACFVVCIRFNGVQLENSRDLSKLEPLLRTNKPRFTVLLTTTTAFAESVFVKTLTGQTLTVQLSRGSSVFEVKSAVMLRTGVPEVQQRLIFAGRQLEDDCLLSKYNITKDSTLHMVSFLRGGGGAPFVDVSDESAMVQIAFSTSAPAWRICTRGLNLEGICRNRSCQAFNKLTIYRLGFKVFNVIQEKATCPLCEREMRVESCGFYDCTWMFEGVRAADQMHMSSSWSVARGKCYHTFGKHDCKLVQWTSLILVARELDRKECCICFDTIHDLESAQSPCGHLLHAPCLDQWKVSCASRRQPASCPLCRDQRLA